MIRLLLWELLGSASRFTRVSEWAWGDQGTGMMGERWVSPLLSAAATHGGGARRVEDGCARDASTCYVRSRVGTGG
jgi:hypothetical protein